MKDLSLLFCQAFTAGTDYPFQLIDAGAACSVAGSATYSQKDAAAAGSTKTGAIRFKNHTKLGNGKPVRFKVQNFAANTGDTALTGIEVVLTAAPDSSAAPGTMATVLTTGVILKAALTAGAILADIPLPKDIAGEWFEIKYILYAGSTTVTSTAIKINGWFEVD